MSGPFMSQKGFYPVCPMILPEGPENFQILLLSAISPEHLPAWHLAGTKRFTGTCSCYHCLKAGCRCSVPGALLLFLMLQVQSPAGRKTLNSLPSPGSLFTSIRPPCFSTNSLHNIRPRPVPGSWLVPLVL